MPSDPGQHPAPPYYQHVSRRARPPMWVWLLVGLGVFLLIGFAIFMWAAVQINNSTAPPPETSIAESEQQAEAAETNLPVSEPDEHLRELNAQFPADQEAFLNGMLEDARDYYMQENNHVMLAAGVALCMKLDDGESAVQVHGRLPAEMSDDTSGTLFGHAVRTLCPQHIERVRAELTELNG